jgi:hypothetical protein
LCASENPYSGGGADGVTFRGDEVVDGGGDDALGAPAGGLGAPFIGEKRTARKTEPGNLFVREMSVLPRRADELERGKGGDP